MNVPFGALLALYAACAAALMVVMARAPIGYLYTLPMVAKVFLNLSALALFVCAVAFTFYTIALVNGAVAPQDSAAIWDIAIEIGCLVASAVILRVVCGHSVVYYWSYHTNGRPGTGAPKGTRLDSRASAPSAESLVWRDFTWPCALSAALALGVTWVALVTGVDPIIFSGAVGASISMLGSTLYGVWRYMRAVRRDAESTGHPGAV